VPINRFEVPSRDCGRTVKKVVGVEARQPICGIGRNRQSLRKNNSLFRSRDGRKIPRAGKPIVDHLERRRAREESFGFLVGRQRDWNTGIEATEKRWRREVVETRSERSEEPETISYSNAGISATFVP